MPVFDRTLPEDLSPALRRAFVGPDRDAFVQARDRLNGAGYGAGIGRAFTSAAPRVAAHAGPDEAIALAGDASRLAIKARPRVAAAYLDLCPVIALKLDDATRFRQWRGVIGRVLAQSPAAAGVLVAGGQTLLDRLGLDPFAAWVETGLRLSGGENRLALAYFRLETPESRRILARHAGDVTFPALESGLRAFYTALWGHAPALREAGTETAQGPVRRTTFSNGLILMPSAFAGFRGQEAQLYRAAIAHVGAHHAHGGARFPVGQLKPMQIAVISLIEDARVETLAMRDMPGLLRLWAPFHTARPDGLATAQALFAGLARGLIDPDFCPAHGWVRKGVEMFQAAAPRLEDPAISREIGNILGNDLGQIRVQFDPLSYVVQPAYRDDNLGLWDLPDDPESAAAPQSFDIDTADARQSELTDAPQDQKHEQTSPDQIEPVRLMAADPEAGRKLISLPEYDYHAGIERDDWVQVTAHDPVPGAPGFWEALRARHDTTITRLQTVIAASQAGTRRRLKRQAEGEALDLDATLDAAIAVRANRQPDPNVYARIQPPARSIAVHLILDISQSTADSAGPGLSILDMERDAAGILAGTMCGLGDDLAMSAFSSCGRHDVRVIPVKAFGAPLTEATGAALAGLRPAYSTRIGAALRFAADSLEQLSRHRRFVLLVTDGAPSDIDVSDPEYLVADARRAVQRMRARGIDALCVSLGQDEGQRQTEIFGRKSCLRISDVATLPGKLSAFYLRMTR